MRNRSALVAATLTATALAVAHALSLSALDRDPAWLEVGTGESIFEWAATLTLGLCATAAAVLAVVDAERRRLLAPLGVGLALVFVTDAFALTGKSAAGDVAILLVLGLVFVLFWRLAQTLGEGGSSVRAGLALLALSVAIRAADPIVSALDWQAGDFAYEAKVVVKHAAELDGWILVAWGIVPEAVSRLSRALGRRAAVEAGDNA